MNKYIIEGNIDFFSELYKSLDEDNDNANIESCLITNEPLTDKYVTLKCGHKFNYIPLFNDILNHKKTFNVMEGKNGLLGPNQLRCPYCRKKQNELLPYYEELGFNKIDGVNYYDPYDKSNIHAEHFASSAKSKQKCEFLFINKEYNPNEPESESNKKYSDSISCNLWGSPINIHNNVDPSQPINFGDSKCYCYKHKLSMIKQYKTEMQIKEKIALKKAKEEEKQKLKEEKVKAKLLEKENKKNKNKNVVLTNDTTVYGCIQILKTGINKGNQCGCKIYANNLCKRHQPK